MLIPHTNKRPDNQDALMAKKIKGTNIPVKDFKGSSDELEELENRIAADIAAGDWKDANDALFSIAYKSGKTGGQGNPSVGKVQSGQYKVTGKSAEGESSNISWAQQAVESESGRSDIYQQRGEGGEPVGKPITGVDFGKPMTEDDISRATEGVTYFTGTNIPTTGFTSRDIGLLNTRISDEIAKGEWGEANDVLYDIALQRGKQEFPEGWTRPVGAEGRTVTGWEQGNPYIGMLQSDMYSLTDPRATSWAQTVGGGPEDEYPERDVYGNLTGNVTTFNTDGTSVTTDSSGNVISTGGGTTFSGLTGSPYYAEDYTVPHMQTGAGWEGLGAEYQPGTVEGLGLLAGDPYTGYQPMDAGLLGAAPSFTPTGGVFNEMHGNLGGDFIGFPNPSGSTNTNTNTNNNTTPITWGYTWIPNPAVTSDVWEGQGKATVGGKQGTWSWDQTSGAS